MYIHPMSPCCMASRPHLATLGSEVVHHGLAQPLRGGAVKEGHLGAVPLLQWAHGAW